MHCRRGRCGRRGGWRGRGYGYGPGYGYGYPGYGYGYPFGWGGYRPYYSPILW
jgi:hypothetical protein